MDSHGRHEQRWRPVDDGGDHDGAGGVGLKDEQHGVLRVRGLFWRPEAEQGAHQQPEIEARDVDQVALVDIRPSAQPRPPHAAAIEDVGERALDLFAAQPHRGAPDAGFQPGAVGVDCLSGRRVAMPAQMAVGGFRFGDPRLPDAAVQTLQAFARMVSLVGDQIAGRLERRFGTEVGQVARGCVQRRRQRGRVALVGFVDRRGDHDARVEIDRVLGLAGQMHRPVLHPRDLRVGIGRARAVGVRQLLALALAIEPRQVFGRRRRDPALLGHPRQHLPVSLAAVASHDGPQRRIGLHRRAVDAQSLALHQPMLGHELQHDAERLLMRLVSIPSK